MLESGYLMMLDWFGLALVQMPELSRAAPNRLKPGINRQHMVPDIFRRIVG